MSFSNGTPPGHSKLAFLTWIALGFTEAEPLHSTVRARLRPSISAQPRKDSMRLQASWASTADVTMFGNMVSGKRSTLKRDIAEKATPAVST